MCHSLLTNGSYAGSEGSARIYVYSDWDSGLRSWVPIFCDGTLMAKVKKGKYFVISASPGRHTLTASDSIPVFVEVVAGKEAFVRTQQNTVVGLTGSYKMSSLKIMPHGRGQSDTNNLVYVDPKQIDSSLVLREDPARLERPTLRKRAQKDLNE
jgi:hypothetical protein